MRSLPSSKKYHNCQLQIGKEIAHQPPWNLNPVLLQLLIRCSPKGSSGWRVRNSVLQGNWWNRFYRIRYFQLNWFHDPNPLLISRKDLPGDISSSWLVQFSSVTQSCPTLWSPMNRSTPGLPVHHLYSNSCPSSRWCHPAISSSVIPFSCPQCLPASRSFPMSQLLHEVAKVLEFQIQH